MFGKEKPKNEVAPVTINRSSSKEVTTLIGEGCKVEGNFFVPTTTRIDGIIKGDLTGEIGIIIGNKGLVEGNVCAKEVVVYGNVKGNIEADKLELKRGSNINGDLTVNNLHTEVGAIMNGSCTMNAREESIPEFEPDSEE
jgi:cytoskeletal protein CcmA (bactofilin family)